MRLKSESVNNRQGVLLRKTAPLSQEPPATGQGERPAPIRAMIVKRGAYGAAYAGVFLFTFLLYLRPGEMFPALGAIPIVKIVTIMAVIVYVGSKLGDGEGTNLSLEAKMMLVLVLVAILLVPFAAAPGDSINTLQEPFIKVVIIFILLTNLIDTRERLFSMWKLVVSFGAFFGFKAIQSFQNGEFSARGERITGLVKGMFGNPNDLATSLDLLIPFAVVLCLTQRGVWRLFYLGCAAIMVVGVVVTFSRGGFLGLVASGGIMIWKLGRGRRLATVLGGVLLVGVLSASVPGGFASRLSTVTDINADKTGSAQERYALMQNTIRLFMSHPVIGLGMGNLHIYSIKELGAHNSYLEVAAELGIFGLLAYLTLIFAPMIKLRRIERRTWNPTPGSDRQMFYMSVGTQAAIAAYMVCSFFSSIQYQWYVYYVVAYAVALIKIHGAEELEKAVEIGPEEGEGDHKQQAGKMGELSLVTRTGNGIVVNTAESR